MPTYAIHCARCRAPSDSGLPTVCHACGAPLLVSYPLESIADALRPENLGARPWTMWRYRELLPLAEGEDPVTLGEGGTPLLNLPDLAAEVGVGRLLIKDEGLNPTGSFKARGLSAAVTRAAADGADGFVIPSAGNAGAALAAYGARVGRPVRVYVPRDTPHAVVAECRAFGATVELVDGLITDCGRRARAWSEETGHFDVSTLREPFRIEGKKTMGYEIAEQLDWQLPDAIVYPTGGGTGLIGMWKAFGELAELGWIPPDPLPRMYAAQAAGCAPIVRAWEAGEMEAEPWEDAETIASGLRVPSALGDFLILEALRESGGSAVAVSDSQIRRGARDMQSHGVGACPEGGATLAALRWLVAGGALGHEDRVICFNTGAWLKYAH